MSSYRDGRPWDGGPPGAEQDYSGQQYAAPVPATDPWTGVSYAQYANYDYSAYGQHGYNYSYDPSYYQQQDNYYGGNKGYPPQASYGMQSSNPQPGGSTSKTYRSRSRSHSPHYSRRERSYSRSRGSVDRSRSGSRSKKGKLKRYSRSYSRSPIKVKKERLTSPQYTDTFKKQKLIIKKEKKSRSRTPGTKDTKHLLRDDKIPSSIDKKIIKKERLSVSPRKATSSKTASRSVSSPKRRTSESSNTVKSNKHKCSTPPIRERSVTPPKCYAHSRSLSASSSRSARSSSRSTRASRYSRASGSRSRSRSTRPPRNKAQRKRSQSRSPSRHRATRSRSRSHSRRRIAKSRSSSASERHNTRSWSNSRLHTRSQHRLSKSRSQSRRRSSRSVSKSRRRSSHSRSGSRHRQSRSCSKSRQKVGKTASKSHRSHSKSRDRRSSSSASRSRSRSDDERRGQFTVADRKRFWKRHRSRIEDKVRTPPKETKPPPGAVEPRSVDDIKYNVPPDIVGPNFADLLTTDQQLPSTSTKVPLPIKNDGSFLEMFKKMQEETKKAEEAEKKIEIKKPILPFIGKRRGGRVLKTGKMPEMLKTAADVTTTPYDPRFPNTNQTKHCYQSYLDYHRCQKVRGENYEPCNFFKKAFRALCPNEWVDKWDTQRAEGTFPSRI